jgi:hypothetical protein
VHKQLLGLAVLLLVSSGCTLNSKANTAARYSTVEVVPSTYGSDADFLNLISDDQKTREQARRNVLVFYNCLTKANQNFGSRDPVVLSRSQFIAFSEIPGRIYQSRLDRLATLARDYNKAAVQIMVDTEVDELRKIRWSEIQREVNAIVTGARKPELDKLRCPVTQVEHRKPAPRRTDVLLRAVFLPPIM